MGVPQGSILGPIFFLIDINDLPNSLYAKDVILYADDLDVVLTSGDIPSLLKETQFCFELMKKQTKLNKLVINKYKTNIISFKIPQIDNVKLDSSYVPVNVVAL